MKFSILKWIGNKDGLSRIGEESWATHWEGESKEQSYRLMDELAISGIKAALYENGIFISRNYSGEWK